MENIKKIIADNLITLRKQNKLTQMELAEKINYSDKAISRWENAEVTPDVETLNMLASVYNIPVTSFFESNVSAAIIKKPVNKLAVSLLAILGVWLAATLLYAIFMSFKILFWQVFIYAFPVSFILAIIFNAIWGKAKHTFVYVSCFGWSVLLSLYILFLSYNMWYIFIIGVPMQITILLCSFIKK